MPAELSEINCIVIFYIKTQTMFNLIILQKKGSQDIEHDDGQEIEY